MITYLAAQKSQAQAIAELIMEAMNHDCCQWFAGPDHTLDDFRQTMTRLVAREDSQYSYTNTLVAMDGERVVGIAVSYDGALLRPLREAFLTAAREDFGRDFSQMDDETQAGELYLDSLAVLDNYRGRGIATRLLQLTIEKARQLGIPATGLLVDQGNPRAEQLYRRVGFQCVGEATWGGHPMRHLQCSSGIDSVVCSC